MRKLRKRVFAAVLAALMIITAMPVTALYASAETGDVSGNAMEQAETEDTDPSGCEDEKTENGFEENAEYDGADTDTRLCAHHREHTQGCGYSRTSEDGEGSSCTYVCHICPVEDLIAALPEKVMEDNGSQVRAQLDEILGLYQELAGEEQEQIDISRCLELQEALDAANTPASVDEGTFDLELFGQKVSSGDSGEGWSYADGVLTLENYHSDDSDLSFIHILNCPMDFTIYLKGKNSVKTSGILSYGNVRGSMIVAGEPGASFSLEGKNWNDNEIVIRNVNLDITTQGMIFLAQGMAIDNATVNINMSGSNGYIYTTHGGFTVQNGSNVTINNSSGDVDYCVATNKAEITDSTLNIINPSGFGVYVTALSQQVSEYKAFITRSTISADVLDAGIHCEEEVSVTNSQITNSGRFLIRSKKAITVDDGSTMNGITYEFFKASTGAAYQVYGAHTLTADLTVAEGGSFIIPEGAALTIPEGATLKNNGTMHIHDKASLTGAGALNGNGDFQIDVNEDLISIPEGLVYTGNDYTDQITLEGTATICGVDFTADTAGWTRSIEPQVVKDAGDYTVTFTNGEKSISKTFTVAQSGTRFEGDVKAYNGDTQTNTFTASDIITVKAAPVATGAAPQKAAARLQSEPGAGQMALYVGDKLVSSEAAEADADGIYTMIISASDVLTLGGVEPNGDPITLTAKFVGNDNMADAAGTVTVNISAVAKVEKDDTTTYVGALGDAFTAENSGATVTLLAEVDLGGSRISIYNNTFTLDLNGQTVKAYNVAFRISGGSITIQDSGIGGKIESSDNTIEVTSGTVSIESGTVSGFSGVQITGGTVNISGGVISGEENGLCVDRGGNITLSGGTYSGRYAISVSNNASVTLKDLLAAGCAYYQNDVPVAKAEGIVGYEAGEVPLDAKPAWLTDTVTVKECNHTGGLTPSGNGYQHGGVCLCCGKDLPLAEHTLGTDGKCTACGAELVAEVNDICYTNFQSAWSMAQSAGTATVTLLADVTLPDDNYVTVASQQNFTLKSPDGEKFTLSGRSGSYGVISVMGSGSLTVENAAVENTNTQYMNNSAICVWNGTGSPQITIGNGATVTGYTGICQRGSTLTLTVSGTVEGMLEDGQGISFMSGTLTVEEGAKISGGGYGYGINQQGGSLIINGGSISGGHGVCITNADSTRLNGGTFTGTGTRANYNAISAKANYNPLPLGDLLETGRAIFKADGTAVERMETSTGAGTFTVKECLHTGVTPTSNKDGTHVLNCPYCGHIGAAANCTYAFIGATGICTACKGSVTVEISGNLIYDGTGKEPEVTVTRDGKALATSDYSVAYTDNINAGTAKVTVTIGNNQGTYTGDFTITPATPTIIWGSISQELIYTGNPAVITEPTVTLVNGEKFNGTISYSYRKQGEADYKDGLPADAGTCMVKAHVDAEGNYAAADSTNELTLTISYMDAPELQYNGIDKKEYYNRDVAVAAVPADNHTYTVSGAMDGEYKESFTIPAQQGTVTKTLYFKNEEGHISDGVNVIVNFDLTPPTGEIAVGAKWWQNILHFVSFGNYAAKEYTVSIKTEDEGGSGIDNDKTEYVIVTGSRQYTDADALAAANLNWSAYNDSSKPAVPVNSSPYVVYARLTDKVGNVTYISTDGILLDSTAPTVSELTVPEETIRDVSAGVTFTVDETADYYYVVMEKDSAAPAAEDIIVTCGAALPEGKTGTAVTGAVDSGKGAVSGDTLPASVDVKNLLPNTAYIVYVTAVDRALDITDSSEGKPAGNISAVKASAAFTTKKTLPVITKAPAVTGTYGQSVGEMTVAGGVAQDRDAVLAGTWTVSDADKDRKPSAGTAEEVTVIFTPDSDKYESVSVRAPLTVEQAEPAVGIVTAGELENTLDVTRVSLKRTDQTIAGTLTLTDSTLKYGTNTYTWKFMPDDTVNYKTVTGEVQITVNDTIPPTAEYRIGIDGWKQFIHTVSFGLFCKDYKTVTIRGTDDTDTVTGSGISLIQYYISEQEITDTDGIAWKNYTEPFSLDAQGTYLIYVKVTDNGGNTAVLNSEGIVIYAESTVSPAVYDYTYKENRDCTVQLAMNGNTFKGITDQEGNAVDTDSYTIGSNGTLILKAAYLDTLDKGRYTYTVSVNPQGIETDQVTLAYPFTVNVKAKELTVTGAAAAGRDYDGTETVKVTAVTLSGAAPGDEVAVDLSGIQGTLSGANAGTYTAVTLPGLTLTGKDSGNYTLVQSSAAVPTSVTIAPLSAEIMVGTDAYTKTFGDAAFILDVTDNNTEADVQYEVTRGADVVSVENGMVTVRGAGEAEITVSLPESVNYTAAENKIITVTVNKKSGYTVAALNRSYYYKDGGTDSIDLAALLPKDCGNAVYRNVVCGESEASVNVTYSAAPAVSGGILSYTLNNGTVNAAGTISVIIATQNYEDITVTVNVKLIDQIPVSLKSGMEVTLNNHVLTYGEPLSDLVFNEAEFVGTDGKTVTGTLAWKEAAAIPDAGTVSAVWIFTPEEDKYASLEGTAAITVNRATPTVSAVPTAADRVYNPQITLKDIVLSGGTVIGVDGKELEGGWSWQSAGLVPNVTDSGYVAVFTPKDTTNYETVTRSITLTVTRAVPYIAELPAAAGITYGETLNDSALSGGTVLHGDGTGQAGDGAGSTGTVNGSTGTAAGSTGTVAGSAETAAGSTVTVAGTFTWKEPSTRPAVADSNVTEYTIIFIPSDTASYNPVEATVTLTVNKAQNAPNMPESAMDVPYSCKQVSSAELPEGWEWQETDREKALEAGKPVSAVAIYTGADSGNYEKETVTVVITRAACTHSNKQIRNAKEATCQETGYTGDIYCTDCGTLLSEGAEIPLASHRGGTATCIKRAVCTVCGQEYGTVDAENHEGGTEVRDSAAAGCTVEGYTGDVYCVACGTKLETGTAVPALGHAYESEVTKEPTEDSEGIRTYTCTRCGSSYTESIDRLDPTNPDNTPEPGPTTTPDNTPEPGPTTTPDNTPEPGKPFIKEKDGKTGWDVIRAEEAASEEGNVINVDMNGTSVVPGDIFDRIRGRDITVTFDMGGGILWSVDGKQILTGQADDIDFSVRKGTDNIPIDIVNNITGERRSIQMSLTHDGAFGFTAVLSINLGKENAGYTASLYYYNEGTGELKFISKGRIADEGTASLAFTHASEYVIVIGEEQGEENGGTAEPEQPERNDGTAGTDENGIMPQSPATGQAGKRRWVIWVTLLTAAMGTGVFLTVRRKRSEENTKQ